MAFQEKPEILIFCAKVASFENTVQPTGVVTSVLSNPSTQKMGKLRPRKGGGAWPQ